ncbi:MAG TPA: hypothetical protein VN213_16265 [Solirubrobacteraceae bacterium]|nr:hypothetical protein [Solirubrobacteraceae bacterium]
MGAAVAFGALLESTGGEPLIVAVHLAYPIADLLRVTLIVGVFGSTGWRPGRAWLTLGSGLLVSAVANTLYLLQAAHETYVEGTWLDALWLPGVLLMGLAAREPLSARVRRVDDGARSRSPPPRRS